MRRARASLVVLLAVAAADAGAQTMLDQEQRLIDIHSLLRDLPPVEAPGALAVGLRGHVLYSESQSPVTDPRTRDRLDTLDFGADLSAGYRFDVGRLGSVTPYAGVGVIRSAGDFHVTSDGVLLTSRYTGLALQGGARLLVKEHWVGVAEVDAFPGRLVHPSLRVAYVLGW